MCERRESWRQQPGTPVFAAPGTPMSRAADFDAAGVRRALAQATHERKPEWHATARGSGTFRKAA